MNYLNHMSYFVEVVKAKSFRGAAIALAMPNSTLSRKIKELEIFIGLRLLHRTTRKLELTEAGQIYYERCRTIIEEARLAHQQLDSLLEQPQGLLRMSLPSDFAIFILGPMIKDFSDAYPNIRFDLDLTPRNVDLVTEPYDLAIRIGQLADSGLIARKLGKLSRSLYASHDYLIEHGIPETPNDLDNHEFLTMRKDLVEQCHLSRGQNQITFKPKGRFQMNSIGLLKCFAVIGAGLAILPDRIVEEAVTSAKLTKVMPDWKADDVTVYALTETRLLPAKTHIFIEFIRQRLNE